MRFSSVLNREYYLPKSRKSRLTISAGLGVIIFLLLILLTPFGFQNIGTFAERIPVAAGYGLIAFFNWYVALVSLKLIKTSKTHLWQIILAIIIFQFFAALLSMFYYSIINKSKLSSELFLWFQIVVFLSGIIPDFCLILFLETNYYLKITTPDNAVLEKNTGKNEKLVTIYDENPDKSLSLLPESIICIQSQDNYIQIKWIANEKDVKSTLLRATLNNTMSILSEFDYIVQCHRSYMVNLRFVKEIKGSALSKKCIMQYSNSVIPVSRSRIDYVMDKLNGKNR